MIHPTAEVEPGAQVGFQTRIWHFVHVRPGAIIGDDCSLGHGVYIDSNVHIGNRVKLQNRVSVYNGVTLEDGVFVGPHATFTNDKYPRAIKPDGSPVKESDWSVEKTLVRQGASIGAGVVVLPGVTIGRWAMIGANALVTRDVPDHGLAIGSPARLVGYACRCGHELHPEELMWRCPTCNSLYHLAPIQAADVD